MRLRYIYLAKLPSFAIFFLLVFPFSIATWIPYGISIASTIMIAWLFLIANALIEKANSYKSFSMNWFYIYLFYSELYIIVFDIFFKNTFPKFIIPFHLIAVIFLFLSLFFVSRLLVFSEEKNLHKNHNCIGTFFLFWFFPIGVWFIHPRLKKVLLQ